MVPAELFYPWLYSLVIIHPEVKNWIKYAKFEEKHNYTQSCRRIYERGVEYFGEDNMDERLLVGFAKFEEAQHEVRATADSVDTETIFCTILLTDKFLEPLGH